jgi:hypothetical protein
MHGAVGEQGEDGGADITAARPRPASTSAGATETAHARELEVLPAATTLVARMTM